MARGETPKFLILDACVVIDYVDADVSVLGTITAHVAPLAVARPVLDEVDQLEEGDAIDLGISIVEIDLTLATEAATGGSALSFEDRVCLLVAKREAWTCVTNDKRLRAACASESVPVMWGLEMMLRAVEVGAMSAEEAVSIAEEMNGINPRYVTETLVREFTRKVREAGH